MKDGEKPRWNSRITVKVIGGLNDKTKQYRATSHCPDGSVHVVLEDTANHARAKVQAVREACPHCSVALSAQSQPVAS